MILRPPKQVSGSGGQWDAFSWMVLGGKRKVSQKSQPFPTLPGMFSVSVGSMGFQMKLKSEGPSADRGGTAHNQAEVVIDAEDIQLPCALCSATALQNEGSPERVASVPLLCVPTVTYWTRSQSLLIFPFPFAVQDVTSP